MVRLLHFYRTLRDRIAAFYGYSLRRQLIFSFGLLVLLAMTSFSYLMYIQQRDFLYSTDVDRAQGLARARLPAVLPWC